MIPVDLTRTSWIRDGEADISVCEEHELVVNCTGQISIWMPEYHKTPVEFSF